MSISNSTAINLNNVGVSSTTPGGKQKEKLSHQLENIVRKTEKNLNTGVYKL